MKNKPWPILILALIQFFMPLFNVLLNSYLNHISPIEYIQVFIKVKSIYEIFDFFLLYPIVGFTIFLMKKWSYPFFLIATLWTFSINCYLWITGNTPPMPFWLFPLVSMINIAFASYFLLPAVRRIYFDQRVRWWETKPRFEIDIPAKIVTQHTIPIHVCDLSEGGAFVKTNEVIKLNKSPKFHLEYEGLDFQVVFEVVHQKEMTENEYGFGLRFLHTNNSLKSIKKVLSKLKASGISVTRVPDPLFLSFKIWFQKVKEGKTSEGFM